jgi:hypothetical protein
MRFNASTVYVRTFTRELAQVPFRDLASARIAGAENQYFLFHELFG